MSAEADSLFAQRGHLDALSHHDGTAVARDEHPTAAQCRANSRLLRCPRGCRLRWARLLGRGPRTGNRRAPAAVRSRAQRAMSTRPLLLHRPVLVPEGNVEPCACGCHRASGNERRSKLLMNASMPQGEWRLPAGPTHDTSGSCVRSVPGRWAQYRACADRPSGRPPPTRRG